MQPRAKPACAWLENSSRLFTGLELCGAWRPPTTFEAPKLCTLLSVAEHTRSANPCQLLYDVPRIDQPEEPAPSRAAVTQKASRPPLQTLWSDSSAARHLPTAAALTAPRAA